MRKVDEQMQQGYKETRFVLETEGLALPAVLTVPEDGEAAWTMVLIPGSRVSDEDGNYPTLEAYPHMYADLARQLAERGHAVLRYAKLGAAGSRVVDDEQATRHPVFAQQQWIARAACATIRGMVPGARRLALVGHSEGAVHGSILAQEAALGVDALVCLSGPAHRFLSLFAEVAQRMAQEQGETIDFGGLQVTAALYIRAFELLQVGEPLTAEILAEPALAAFVHGLMGEPGSRTERYIRDYDAVEPMVEIAKVPCPVLLVQGGMDQSAVLPESGQWLAEARRAVHPGATALAFFPELQHYYKRAEAGLTAQESLRLDGETDARVSAAIATWLGGLAE